MRHIESEVCHDVVGTEVGVGGIVFVDAVATILRAVEEIGGRCSLFIDLQESVVGVDDVACGVDVHTRIVGAYGLKSSKFVAGLEYQLRQVLIDDLRGLDALGIAEGDAIVGASILLDDGYKFGEWVGYLILILCNRKIDLLKYVVDTQVGARCRFACDGDLSFVDAETCLKQRLVGVAFVEDL